MKIFFFDTGSAALWVGGIAITLHTSQSAMDYKGPMSWETLAPKQNAPERRVVLKYPAHILTGFRILSHYKLVAPEHFALA